MRVIQIWAFLSRQKKVIGVTFLLVMSLVVAGGYLIEPTYRSSCKLIIPGEGEKNTASMIGGGLGGSQGIPVPQAEAAVEKVLAAPTSYVDETAFRLQLRNEDGSLMSMEELRPNSASLPFAKWLFPEPHVDIRRYGESDMLEIEATASDAKQAKLMANTLAGIIVAESRKDVRESFQDAKVLLKARLREVREDYESRLKNIADLEKEQKSVNLDVETKLAAEKMSELLRKKEDTLISLSQVRAKVNHLEKELEKQSVGFVSVSALQENPHIRELKKTLAALYLELAEARSEFTQEHPRVMSLEEQIVALKAEIETEIGVYRSSAPDLSALEEEVSALEARLVALDSGINAHLASLKELPGKASRRAGLEIGLQGMPKTYGTLLRSLEGLNIAEGAGLAAIKVVEPAREPRSAVFPKKEINVGVGLLLALACSMGLALIREYLDDTMKSAEDVKALSPKALVGSIPRFQDTGVTLISGRDTNDPLYESYRWLRTHFDFIEHMKTGRTKSLMITSAGPGEGKSTTVANLGIALANDGKSVILVDTDVRRPSLDRYFGLRNELGLTELLRDKAALTDAIQPTQIDNLRVVVSGQPHEDPGRLLESPRMERLLGELRAEYDVVILDSAPLLVKMDGLALAKWVDDSVVVLESKRTTRSDFVRLMELFEGTRINPMGFILNKHSISKPDASYYPYYVKSRRIEPSRRVDGGKMRMLDEEISP